MITCRLVQGLSLLIIAFGIKIIWNEFFSMAVSDLGEEDFMIGLFFCCPLKTGI